jgi:hypothetical protein
MDSDRELNNKTTLNYDNQMVLFRLISTESEEKEEVAPCG